MLVDGVLSSLRKDGASDGEPETESENSIAGGVVEATQLARRCFFLLLESQVVDLHYHSRLFLLMCGNVYTRLKGAAGGLYAAAATPDGFRIQTVEMASALAAYQSYRHHRRRYVDETVHDLDSEIAQRQALMEAAAAQEKSRAMSEMRDLLDLCLKKRRVVLGVVQDGVARADHAELLKVKSNLTGYVDNCSAAIEAYNSPAPKPNSPAPAPAEAEPEPAEAPAPITAPDDATGAAGAGEVEVDPKDEANAAQEARRLQLEMELRKLDEQRQEVVSRISLLDWTGERLSVDFYTGLLHFAPILLHYCSILLDRFFRLPGGIEEENEDGEGAADGGEGAAAKKSQVRVESSGSDSGNLSPSHPNSERICAAVRGAVKDTLQEMLKWEVLQIDTSLCRATMQYLKFTQQYLQRRARASEMLTRRLAMCSARFDTLIDSAQKGLAPSTPIDHHSEISPPTPRTTSASPGTREDGSSVDPTGLSQILQLPVSRAEAVKECKKQKRMVRDFPPFHSLFSTFTPISLQLHSNFAPFHFTFTRSDSISDSIFLPWPLAGV